VQPQFSILSHTHSLPILAFRLTNQFTVSLPCTSRSLQLSISLRHSYLNAMLDALPIIIIHLTTLILLGEECSCSLISPRCKYSPQHPVLITLSLCTFLSVRDQVSHPYGTTGKTTVSFILMSAVR
jgi:hypothetical protein